MLWYRLFEVLGVAIGAAMIIILGIFVVAKIVKTKEINSFKKKYALITSGMTRQQVIEVMGPYYSRSMMNQTETLVWKCRRYSAIEKELLSRKDIELKVIVSLDNGIVDCFSIDQE